MFHIVFEYFKHAFYITVFVLFVCFGLLMHVLRSLVLPSVPSRWCMLVRTRWASDTCQRYMANCLHSVSTLGWDNLDGSTYWRPSRGRLTLRTSLCVLSGWRQRPDLMIVADMTAMDGLTMQPTLKGRPMFIGQHLTVCIDLSGWPEFWWSMPLWGWWCQESQPSYTLSMLEVCWFYPHQMFPDHPCQFGWRGRSLSNKQIFRLFYWFTFLAYHLLIGRITHTC